MCLPSDAFCNTYRLTWVSLTLDEGYLLTAAPPDLKRGVAPLGPPAPVHPPLLGCQVAPLSPVLGCNLKNDRMISVRFQGKPFNITVIQVYAPTSNAEEAEVQWFYEDLQDLQDLLELTPPKDVLFIIGDWNAKLGSQEHLG